MRFSFHTHSDFCDGRVPLAAMAQAAWESGYDILGFSAHAPLSFDAPWNLQASRMVEYADTVRSMDAKYSPRGMPVLLGLEVDYIPGLARPDDTRYDPANLDFRIGSVHYMTDLGPERFTVDEPEDEFAGHVRMLGHGGGMAIVRRYYRSLCELLEIGGFDILGHFDLVKKNNPHKRYFDEDAPEYLNLVDEAVELASRNDRMVEINTGGIARRKTTSTYPSVAILKKMRAKGVRVTVGDDAHAPAHLGAFQDMARQAALEAGYTSIFYLDSGKQWREIGIDELGKPSSRI